MDMQQKMALSERCYLSAVGTEPCAHSDVVSRLREGIVDVNGFVAHQTTRTQYWPTTFMTNPHFAKSLTNGVKSFKFLLEAQTAQDYTDSNWKRLNTSGKWTTSEFNLTNFQLKSVEVSTSIKLRCFPMLAKVQGGCSVHESLMEVPNGCCYKKGCEGFRVGDIRYLNDGTLVVILALLVVDKNYLKHKKLEKTFPFSFLAVVGDLSNLNECTCFLVDQVSIMTLLREKDICSFTPLISSQVYRIDEDLYDKYMQSCCELLGDGEKNDFNTFSCPAPEDHCTGARKAFHREAPKTKTTEDEEQQTSRKQSARKNKREAVVEESDDDDDDDDEMLKPANKKCRAAPVKKILKTEKVVPKAAGYYSHVYFFCKYSIHICLIYNVYCWMCFALNSFFNSKASFITIRKLQGKCSFNFSRRKCCTPGVIAAP
jgi:hypothetical protein